jgi:hypothetical protein
MSPEEEARAAELESKVAKEAEESLAIAKTLAADEAELAHMRAAPAAETTASEAIEADALDAPPSVVVTEMHDAPATGEPRTEVPMVVDADGVARGELHEPAAAVPAAVTARVACGKCGRNSPYLPCPLHGQTPKT